MICTKCDNKVDDYRYHLGYTECVDCSDTEKYSAHVVYPHKTGAFVQPVSETASKNLKRMDRRSVGGNRTSKGIYVDNSWDRYLKSLENPKPKKVSTYVPPKVTYNHKTYNQVYNDVLTYYDNHGYDPAMNHVHDMYREDAITMMTRNKLRSDITALQMLPKRLRKWVRKIN